MDTLVGNRCPACDGFVPRLGSEELRRLEQELGGDWRIVGDHHLEREYSFVDFATALAFTQRVGEVAENEGHHPEVCVAWGRVRVTVWTHKVDGLTGADFVLAAKIDRAFASAHTRHL